MKYKVFSLFILCAAFGATASANGLCKQQLDPFSDSLQVKFSSKGNLIKLYPNPTTNGSVTISTTNTEDLHFYVFDLTGTLIHQATLKNGAKHVLPILKKGIYMYDVFKNDTSIEEGRILVQ